MEYIISKRGGIMNIHKDFIELLGYSQSFGDLTVIPTRIDADDVNCEVEFQTVNKLKMTRTVVRKGKHDNYIFSTSINNISFTINLQTGVIKKKRERKE